MAVDDSRNHPLVLVLRSRNTDLASQADRLIQHSSRILEFTLSTFSSGTDHTYRHTCAVEKIARMLLTDRFLAFMSDEEIFILTVACHYHDLAMAGTEADDNSSETRESVRREHAIRIGDKIRERWKELGFESHRMAHVVGEVCRGHRPKKTADGAATWDELNQAEVLGPSVAIRVRLLSALIYAADELHLGDDRAPHRVESWRKIGDEESRRHWRRHQAISGPALGTSSSLLLFQASTKTPEFEEDLRSQVFRKAFSALKDLRRQAVTAGITEELPSVRIQWQRSDLWELLLPLVCDDMKPRSRNEIVMAIVARFGEQTVGHTNLDNLCEEFGNTEPELVTGIERVVGDALLTRQLVTQSDRAECLLSTSDKHTDIFFQRARDADDLNLLFVGRYRESRQEELFASEFGRLYVRNSVLPAIEQAYSVRIGLMANTEPIRVLMESCPTAARLVRDYAPSPNNLCKESLLAQAAITGALFDVHANPERLLDASLRKALRQLTEKNEQVVATIRVLEDLALVGGFSYEQITDAVCASEAVQKMMEAERDTKI